MKKLLASIVMFCLALATAARAQGWDPAIVDRFSRLPVQNEGRVKPIQTYAYWLLVRLNGRGATKAPDGSPLTPTEWLLDTLFFPEKSAQYETFLVENDEVVDALGLSHEQKNKRDRYSFTALEPARGRLMQLGQQFGSIDSKQRTPVQEQLVRLAGNVFEYEWVRRYFDAARGSLAEREKSLAGRHLAIVPPPADTKKWKEWYSIGEVEEAIAIYGEEAFSAQKDAAKSWSALIALRDKPAEFAKAFAAACDAVEGLGRARSEIGKVPLEVTYYRLDLVYRSLYAFGLAFVLCAFWWLRPRSTKLRWTVFGATTLATVVLCTAITLRCILRERPPVTTLYETILFITGVAAIVALLMEILQKRGLALSLATVLGFVGVYLANRYEVGESTGRVDTMPTLVAVLDTNFWLATHVTTVTIGYSAGLLAAAIAHIYLIAKFLGLRKGDRAFYSGISRSVYGVICFGLFFSVVGTILGGIWANDSWGRFWGWDPKENGALLICLAEIAILHSRMGGYVREHGICIAAIGNGMVVAASWWGVNLLGIGLHSYGFTSGIFVLLLGFWISQVVVMVLGWIGWERQKALAVEMAGNGRKGNSEAVPEPGF